MTEEHLKTEIERRINLVLSDPKFTGNYDQAKEIVLEVMGFKEIIPDKDAMRIK